MVSKIFLLEGLKFYGTNFTLNSDVDQDKDMFDTYKMFLYMSSLDSGPVIEC